MEFLPPIHFDWVTLNPPSPQPTVQHLGLTWVQVHGVRLPKRSEPQWPPNFLRGLTETNAWEQNGGKDGRSCFDSCPVDLQHMSPETLSAGRKAFALKAHNSTFLARNFAHIIPNSFFKAHNFAFQLVSLSNHIATTIGSPHVVDCRCSVWVLFSREKIFQGQKQNNLITQIVPTFSPTIIAKM